MNEPVEGYKAKITQREVSEAPPTQVMPQKVNTERWQAQQHRARLSLFTMTLLLGVMTYLAFSIVEATSYLLERFASAPISTVVLAGLLSLFTFCLVWLIGREVRGFTAVNQYLEKTVVVETLEKQPPAMVIQALDKHAATFSKGSFAAHQYRQFKQTRSADMSAAELIRLYQRTVTEPVAQKAHSVVKSESLISGSLAFVSPNHLIQTLTILWISLRTVRRVAQVFGLRPATAGNWKLLTLLAQNLAAQSIFDLATDEIANQISGSLTARFVENSAEAVAAGALNVRLGRTLIRLLR